VQALERLRGHAPEQGAADPVLVELDHAAVVRAARAHEAAQAQLVDEDEVVGVEVGGAARDAELERAARDGEQVEQGTSPRARR
jgi:hypothetical protein